MKSLSIMHGEIVTVVDPCPECGLAELEDVDVVYGPDGDEATFYRCPQCGYIEDRNE